MQCLQRLVLGVTTLAALTWPMAAIASPIRELPVIDGIRPSRVAYWVSENRPRPKVEKAIWAVLPAATQADSSPREQLRYYYNRIDLNGDRRLETIVYVVGRRTCWRDGCLALIFEQSSDGLQLVNQFSAVQTPIVVLDRKTRGWQDLLFFVSSENTPPRYTLVRFDGQRYADPPATQPTIPPGTRLRGTAILADRLTLTNGLPLRTPQQLANLTEPDSEATYSHREQANFHPITPKTAPRK